MGNQQPLLEVTGKILNVDTSVQIMEPEVPKTYVLEQNYPNPFNSSTAIRYYVAQQEKIKLEVFNLLGERISVLVDEEKEAGWQSIIFEAKELPSGIYFYQMTAPSFLKVGKMILVR
jgi:hypothetical protein